MCRRYPREEDYFLWNLWVYGSRNDIQSRIWLSDRHLGNGCFTLRDASWQRAFRGQKYCLSSIIYDEKKDRICTSAFVECKGFNISNSSIWCLETTLNYVNFCTSLGKSHVELYKQLFKTLKCIFSKGYPPFDQHDSSVEDKLEWKVLISK